MGAKRRNAHAIDSPRSAAMETDHLGKVGQDDPDGGERVGGALLMDASDGVGGLAGPGGGEEE